MQLFGTYIINNQLIKESNRDFRQIDGLQLCEEAEFGAQNCQNSTKVDAM